MTEEFLKYIQIQTLCKVPFIDVAGIDFERGEGAKIECKPIQITEIILNMLKGFQKSCSVSELESKLYRLQQKKTLYLTKYIQESSFPAKGTNLSRIKNTAKRKLFVIC